MIEIMFILFIEKIHIEICVLQGEYLLAILGHGLFVMHGHYDGCCLS
jgi:hypothetical protein